MQISTRCSTLRHSFGLIGVESASTESSSLRRSYEEQLSCGESLWRGQTRAIFFKKMKTEQVATGMLGNRHWLNMHLMLTRGPVAGAWAILRMRRQNLPRPGWVKHRRMCELVVSSPLFFFVHYPLIWYRQQTGVTQEKLEVPAGSGELSGSFCRLTGRIVTYRSVSNSSRNVHIWIFPDLYILTSPLSSRTNGTQWCQGESNFPLCFS